MITKHSTKIPAIVVQGTSYHKKSLASLPIGDVENIRCGGNDLRLGFYAAEWNGWRHNVCIMRRWRS